MTRKALKEKFNQKLDKGTFKNIIAAVLEDDVDDDTGETAEAVAEVVPETTAWARALQGAQTALCQHHVQKSCGADVKIHAKEHEVCAETGVNQSCCRSSRRGSRCDSRRFCRAKTGSERPAEEKIRCNEHSS